MRGLIAPDRSTDRTEVKGERKSSGSQLAESAAPATLEQRVTALPRARVLGVDLTIPLLVAMGLAGVWFPSAPCAGPSAPIRSAESAYSMSVA